MKKNAFTLVEALLTVTLLTVLVALTVNWINPRKNIEETNDVRRDADLQSLIDAIYIYAADKGDFPINITNTPTAIGSGIGEIDLCENLVPEYIVEMPVDPNAAGVYFTDCSSYYTGYTIYNDSITNRLCLQAPHAERRTIEINL